MFLKEEEINGYVLTERIRKARRRHHLSAPCQALYYELVAICNEESWDDMFKCSNDELTKALNVTEKSLINYRLELIQAGLLGYRSGKTKKNISDYSFTKILNGCKIYNQSDSPNASQSGSPNASPKGKKGSDCNRGKTKSKTKQKDSGDSSPPEEKKMYWQKFVAVFENFYTQKTNSKYIYQKKDWGCIEKIYDFLKNRSEAMNLEWSENNCLVGFATYLKKAYEKDNWIKENFSIPNILSQFNQIANATGTGNTNNRQTNKPNDSADRFKP